MLSRKISLGIVMMLCLVPSLVSAAVDPAALRQELERIEDLRLLHWYAINDVHDTKALAIYLAGWGGPNRAGESESLMQEAEDVYGLVRGIDHGGMTLQAQLDALGAEGTVQAQFDLLQRARRSVAPQVVEFWQACGALKADLAKQVNEAAAAKARWQVTSRPEPWNDARDADVPGGFERGVLLGEQFFKLPPEDQDYALAKAAKQGITYVNVFHPPLSDWARIERTPGNYDFAALDAAMAMFARHGIRVCPMLATFTGSPPEWMVGVDSKAPSDHQFTTRSRGRDGTEQVTGSGINLFNPPTGQAFARFLEAYAAHLEEKWSAQVDAVFVEGGQREIEAPADQSPAMGAFWREWSKTDTPWRTPESLAAEPNPDEAAIARAEMCRETWLLGYVRTVTAALRKGWPGLRVQTMTVNDDFHRTQAKVTGKSRDLYALTQLSDNPGTGSTCPPSLQMLRSFADGRWTWAWAMHSGCGATPAACFAEGPWHDMSRMTCGWLVGNIIRQNYPGSWFRYRDWQLGDFGIGSYMMSARRAQESAPIVLNTASVPAQVAILWSQTTRRRDRSWQLFQSAFAWGHLLTRSQIAYDYIPEVGAGPNTRFADRLTRYKVLILPNTQSMADATCAAIRDWVNRGGIALGFGAPGLYDELGRRRTGLPLADVFGADLAKMRVPGMITPDKLDTTHSEGSYTFGNPPPRAYKFETALTAALEPAAGSTPRAWFAGTDKDVAIVENTFGQGKAMLCGFAVGFEYFESATYEVTYGLTHSRASNYNFEQKRYEQWIVKELEKLGVTRELTLPRGNFLRAQRGDDPDWYHVYRNSPEYSEYIFEEERPVRTVTAWLRKRDGIDNLYVGLANTEGNYFWQRAYVRCMMSGAGITASVASPGDGAVVFDARLGVPVPSNVTPDGRIGFRTWVPMAQSAAFAVAPGGNVRLFGEANVTGVPPAQLAGLSHLKETGPAFAAFEILDAPKVAEFLNSLKGTSIVIGCGDRRFKPAAKAVADWLKQAYQIDSRITTEGPRASCRFDYMDSFGWTQYTEDPVHAAVLIGNCQDNGLMWKFLKCHGNVCWLPLEINQNFPGLGKAVVMVSSPVITDNSGNIRRKDAPLQLVIGATYPGDAMRAIEELRKMK